MKRSFYPLMALVACPCLSVGSQREPASLLISPPPLSSVPHKGPLQQWVDNFYQGVKNKILVFRGQRQSPTSESPNKTIDEKVGFLGDAYSSPDFVTRDLFRNLDLPAARFDVVILRNPVGLLPDSKDIQAALRAVKTGGKVYIPLEYFLSVRTPSELKQPGNEDDTLTLLAEKIVLQDTALDAIYLSEGPVRRGTTPTGERASSLLAITKEIGKYSNTSYWPDIQKPQHNKNSLCLDIIRMFPNLLPPHSSIGVVPNNQLDMIQTQFEEIVVLSITNTE